MKFRVPVTPLLILAIGILLSFCTGSSRADDRPLIALERISIATGLDYAWYSDTDGGDDLTGFMKKEWEVPLNLSYNLVATDAHKPILSLIAGTSWGTDTHMLKTRLGLRVILFAGGE